MRKHKRESKYNELIKWGIYYVILLMAYTLSSTPQFLEILGIKPVLMFGAVVAVAMREDVITTSAYAMVTGFLFDISTNSLFGFNAIYFFVIGVLISLLCSYFLHTRLVTYICMITTTIVMQTIVWYTFYMWVWKVEEANVIFIKHSVPTMIYSAVMGIPMYYLIKVVEQRYSRGR